MRSSKAKPFRPRKACAHLTEVNPSRWPTARVRWENRRRQTLTLDAVKKARCKSRDTDQWARRRARRPGAIQFDNAGDQVVKSPEDNAKACTHVSVGHSARSRGGFTFRSGERSYSERPRLPAARPLRTRRRHDRSLWDRRLVPSFGLAPVGPSFLSIGQMVRSREPADTLLRRWGVATRLPRRHAPRRDPLCLRRRNLRWRRASTEGRRRLSHVLRRSVIVRHVVLQMIGTTPPR